MTTTTDRSTESGTESRSTRYSALGPLLFESWYVIALRDDVDRELRQITVCGQPLVYYRAADGSPVVLDDRCAHRRYSLSKSHLVGDTIRCGYHGYTFDRTGACIDAPCATRTLNFGVRAFRSVERGPYLWVWMGVGPADPDEIPMPAQAEDVTYGFAGYTFNACNYLLLHENLLDLTHLHYLHGPLIADEEYARVPPRVLTAPGPKTVGHAKDIESTRFSFPGLCCGADPTMLVRQVEQVWSTAPSMNYGLETFFHPDGRPTTPHRVLVMHAITPETDTTTHQHWCLRFDAPLVGDETDLAELIQGVFQQDVEALAIQQRNIDGDTRDGAVEQSTAADVSALKLRQIVARLHAAEISLRQDGRKDA